MSTRLPNRRRPTPLRLLLMLASTVGLVADCPISRGQDDLGTFAAELPFPEVIVTDPRPFVRTRAETGQLPGLAPLAQLTATTRIGSTETGADVGSADRPDVEHPDVEPWQVNEVLGTTTQFTSLPPRVPLGGTSRHQPLYFEDANLERYGSSRFRHLQPIRSGIHFGLAAVSLPYQMTVQRPDQVYQYDHPFDSGRYGYRQRTLPPAEKRAALMQGAAVVGLIFLLP